MRQNKSKTVVNAADTSILMHDATGALSTQQFGDSSDIDSRMKGHHDDYVRRTVPGAKTSFLCQDLMRAKDRKIPSRLIGESY